MALMVYGKKSRINNDGWQSHIPCFYYKNLMNHGIYKSHKDRFVYLWHMCLNLQPINFKLKLFFSTMHGLRFISIMAFIRITQDENICGNMVLMSWSFFMSGKVTKSTYWHNEKMVLVCMPIKKPLGYKRFLALSKLTNVPTP